MYIKCQLQQYTCHYRPPAFWGNGYRYLENSQLLSQAYARRHHVYPPARDQIYAGWSKSDRNLKIYNLKVQTIATCEFHRNAQRTLYFFNNKIFCSCSSSIRQHEVELLWLNWHNCHLSAKIVTNRAINVFRKSCFAHFCENHYLATVYTLWIIINSTFSNIHGLPSIYDSFHSPNITAMQCFM